MNSRNWCHYEQNSDTQYVYCFGDRVNKVVEVVLYRTSRRYLLPCRCPALGCLCKYLQVQLWLFPEEKLMDNLCYF